jgi:hypothetical protein
MLLHEAPSPTGRSLGALCRNWLVSRATPFFREGFPWATGRRQEGLAIASTELNRICGARSIFGHAGSRSAVVTTRPFADIAGAMGCEKTGCPVWSQAITACWFSFRRRPGSPTRRHRRHHGGLPRRHLHRLLCGTTNQRDHEDTESQDSQAQRVQQTRDGKHRGRILPNRPTPCEPRAHSC